MPDIHALTTQISEVTGIAFQLRRQTDVGGGCINRAVVVEDETRRFFVKYNVAARLEMFAAEARGLEVLAAAQALRVPQPVCYGVADDDAYLVLEHIAFGNHQDPAALGHGLARQHAVTQTQFGWERDNTIGSTAQLNPLDTDWPRFWRDRRLEVQLRLAVDNGYTGALLRKGERLLADIDVFFSNYTSRPALLHGDLWSGNYDYDDTGAPVIFDPAVYFGDREADIAMTELFGGFPPTFYSAYREVAPLDAGYRVRKSLYNLYHVLNHLNLFGGGYRAQAEHLIDILLAEIRA